MSLILGISESHNGSVALIKNGKVLSAIQAERLTRVKRQALYAKKDDLALSQCVQYCLKACSVDAEDISAVAITTPWEVRKISNKDIFKIIDAQPKNYLGTYYVPHHYSHMEYILHYGNNQPGIVLVIDGSGSLEECREQFNIEEIKDTRALKFIHDAGKEVISAYSFDGNKATLIYRMSPSSALSDDANKNSGGLLQSIGHYWEWASLYCCGSRNEAGKVMGLAAFGGKNKFKNSPVLSLKTNGEISLDYDRLKSECTQPNLFQEDLTDHEHYHEIGYLVQTETEQTLLALIELLKKKFASDVLYLSGGVALNVVANEKIINSSLFDRVVLNGSVEDNGTAIGAALATSIKLGSQRKSSDITDYYGCSYSTDEIINALSMYSFEYKELPKSEVFSTAADLLSNGKIVAWFQGKSEFGPRALGNRSILANPTRADTKYLLDHLMKCRDRYRPYAPIVIEEKASDFFAFEGTSPVMMRNVRVTSDQLTAITHVDHSARVQTVNKTQNPFMYKLLVQFEKRTGVPVLLNTSFNLPGEPIVESPDDALKSFTNGAIDYLVMGNILVRR